MRVVKARLDLFFLPLDDRALHVHARPIRAGGHDQRHQGLDPLGRRIITGNRTRQKGGDGNPIDSTVLVESSRGEAATSNQEVVDE